MTETFIELKFVELHSALFLAGKNFGLKLDPHKTTGLGLIYDRQEKELHVTWNKQTAIVPYSNVVCMHEGKIEEPKPIAPVVIIPPVKMSAQVESPMSHVHAGPGHGKTGR